MKLFHRTTAEAAVRTHRNRYSNATGKNGTDVGVAVRFSEAPFDVDESTLPLQIDFGWLAPEARCAGPDQARRGVRRRNHER